MLRKPNQSRRFKNSDTTRLRNSRTDTQQARVLHWGRDHKIGLLASAILALLLLTWLFSTVTIDNPRSRFNLGPSKRAYDAIVTLQDAGVQLSSAAFVPALWLCGRGHDIKSGVYSIPPETTNGDVLFRLCAGKAKPYSVLFVEGWTFKQMRNALNQAEFIQHETIDLSDNEIMTLLGKPDVAAEGRFFPNTYQISPNTSDLHILKKAYDLMEVRLQKAWESRDSNLPITTTHQALILASLVEKETGVDADRTKIASVFVNRLRKGMRLQTDPSVIYGLGSNFDGNITKADLRADTPYNTYTRAGLPPTPIAAPSSAALNAATHPAQTNALYFVAKGDGLSYFSATLQEHNQAVQKYLLKK